MPECRPGSLFALKSAAILSNYNTIRFSQSTDWFHVLDIGVALHSKISQLKNRRASRLHDTHGMVATPENVFFTTLFLRLFTRACYY